MSLTRFGDNDKKFQSAKIITSTWSDNTNNLQVNFTSSQNNFTSATSSGNFYINVYHKDVSNTDSEIQYAIAYGHKNGSGSPDFTNDTGSFGKGASRAIYGQYRQLIYGDEDQNFQFSTHTPDDIYVLNVNRARYKNQLSLSTLSLHITGALADSGTLKLTDDSISSNGAAVLTNLGRQFNIVSGANGVMSGSTVFQVGGSASYGLYYPDSGIVILNPDAFVSHSGGAPLDPFPARNSGLSTNSDRNTARLFNCISESAHFIIDSEEIVTSRYYFVRARNYEYNYTTNPSFQDENGNVLFQSMINSPKTYITTVGLYNDKNELLAVAKLSQPVAKDPTKEALIRVKLDY
tara:strand:+ start:5865 stop:6911 length:1047 start_codon:yes stop_codon:yes gene_type:complete